jgi:uncharacterized protein (TIGR02001 family)
MKMQLGLAAVALASLSAAANALELTLSPDLSSDYDFRGISQNERNPALSAGLDLTGDSGFSAGLWASQIDFDSETDIELDVLLGYSGGSDETFTWGVGGVLYTYLSESDLNYPEYYVSLGKQFTDAFSLEGKLWYSNDYVAADESATYFEANARFELPKDFGLELHLGRSSGDFWDAVNGGGYTDYAVALTYDYKDFSFALKYIDGSDLPDAGVDLFSTDAKLLLSVSTSLSLFNSGGKE